ncbi:glorund [Carabus blaptoides fortunei]
MLKTEPSMRDINMSGGGDQEDGYVVKLRGLPWSTTIDEILKFFRDCKILDGPNGVHMTTSREGRPSGEAFVELIDEEDLKHALKRDRDHMGNRYIEVFKVNRAEMEWVVKRSGPQDSFSEDGCIRLRGLPFGCSKEEIAQFFTGLEIVPNGITLLTDYSGRSTGEAYVQFVNKEVAEKALQKHRERIGHRYIEIFRSSLFEIHGAVGGPNRRLSSAPAMSYSSRPAPYDRGDRFGGANRYQPNNNRGSRNYKDYNNYDNSPWIGNSPGGGYRNGPGGGGGGGGGGGMGGGGGGNMKQFGGHNGNMGSDRRNIGVHCVHMRGLPFKATQQDVAYFFKPAIPIGIHMLLDNSGRASGEADVEFGTHEDAVKAMTKDKGHMEHRYIELFLNSSPGTAAATSSSHGYSGGGSGGHRGGRDNFKLKQIRGNDFSSFI